MEIVKPPIAYEPFPRTPSGALSRDEIVKDFYDSPFNTWEEFCAARKYNPNPQRGLPAHALEAEKRGKKLWSEVRGDAIDRAYRLETRHYLRQVKAVDRVPSALMDLWDVLEYHITLDREDILADLEAKKVGTYSHKTRRFKGTVRDVATMAAASKFIQESLYSALGLDRLKGDLSERLREKIDQRVEYIESVSAGEHMDVEVMGSGDVEERIVRAFQRYMDPARLVEGTDESAADKAKTD